MVLVVKLVRFILVLYELKMPLHQFHITKIAPDCIRSYDYVK